jgi:hypothetical protein
MSPRRVAPAGLIALIAAGAVALAAPAGALAQAAPANDQRSAAQVLGAPPSSASGTTVGAKVDATAEPTGDCGATGASVWYIINAAGDQRLVASLDANGDLDATIDVFRRQRSQATAITCDSTDKDGAASVTFSAKKGESYLVRVAQLPNSVAGTFHLDLAAAQPAPTPPGARLPGAGVTRTLDRVANVTDAFSARLHAGTPYRINLDAQMQDGCMALELFAPGTSSFEDDEPAKTLSCGGYLLFTPGPGESGRYSFLVRSSSRVRGAQRYHLQVAPAGRDDTSPGVFLHNFARVRGAVHGSRIDVVDVYRFDVTTRSTLFASLTTGADLDLVLLRDDGRRLACACGDSGNVDLHRGLRPGRYFLAVRARDGSSGGYTLRRASRTITKSVIKVQGSRTAQAAPGTSVNVAVSTSPSVNGPVTITVERFDPLSGWRFFRRYHAHGAITFTPPAVGKYRFSGSFDGTRGAAASTTGFARLTVAGPLVE